MNDSKSRPSERSTPTEPNERTPGSAPGASSTAAEGSGMELGKRARVLTRELLTSTESEQRAQQQVEDTAAELAGPIVALLVGGWFLALGWLFALRPRIVSRL